VIDSRLEIDAAARILQPPGDVLLYCAEAHAASARATALRAAAPGLTIVAAAADTRGKTNLLAVLEDLATRGVNELHVEAGHRLNGSLVRAGLVDEWLVYLAPKLLGSGRGMAEIGPLQDLTQATELEFIDITPVGLDLRLRARPPGRERF
jgi:diaminohydroxyphosphoribosylaminopyrimidine deaminase/5-amino-6-(5-phosphoribosylamino)uracil reductase